MLVAVSQHATSPLGGVHVAVQSEFWVQWPLQLELGIVLSAAVDVSCSWMLLSYAVWYDVSGALPESTTNIDPPASAGPIGGSTASSDDAQATARHARPRRDPSDCRLVYFTDLGVAYATAQFGTTQDRRTRRSGQ